MFRLYKFVETITMLAHYSDQTVGFCYDVILIFQISDIDLEFKMSEILMRSSHYGYVNKKRWASGL